MVKKKLRSKDLDTEKPKRRGGTPPKEFQFKKGNNANPIGGRAHNPEIRAVREMTQATVAACIKEVMTGTEKDILLKLKDPKTPIGEIIVLRAALDAAKHGHYTKYNEILERAIGKVPQVLDMQTKGESLNVSKEDKEILRKAISDVDKDV